MTRLPRILVAALVPLLVEVTVAVAPTRGGGVRAALAIRF
jgi:hypothetical protein